MHNVIIVMFVVIFLCACTNIDEPTSQADFSQSMQDLQHAYDAALSSGNGIQQKEVESTATMFLRKSSHRADGWIGEVESVSSQNRVVVTLKHRSHEYRLIIIDPRAIEYASSLKAGDVLIFYGNIGHERSFSIAGGMREPEFEFVPNKFHRATDSEIVIQDKTLLAAHMVAEKQAVVDGRIESEVISKCQQRSKSLLMYPDSADFSLIQQSIKKISPDTWIYFNVVETRDDSGHAIEKQFKCIASIAYTRNAFNVAGVQVEFIL